MSEIQDNNESNVKTLKLNRIYSMRLVSLLDLKPHDIVFSLDKEKLIKIHNDSHVSDGNEYKLSNYPNFTFMYKEGTPFQWFIEPLPEFIDKGLAGIIENWITDEDLEQVKSKTYFIE